MPLYPHEAPRHRAPRTAQIALLCFLGGYVIALGSALEASTAPESSAVAIDEAEHEHSQRVAKTTESATRERNRRPRAQQTFSQ